MTFSISLLFVCPDTDLSGSHIWDASTAATLDAIRAKYEHLGKTVEIHGLNRSSEARFKLLSGQLGDSP